eukprot:Gb_33527 [translate_table: standard]
MEEQQPSLRVDEVSANLPPSQMVEYESNPAAAEMPGLLHQTGHANEIDNGDVLPLQDNAIALHQQSEPEDPPAPPTEEDRLWNTVTSNSTDFSAWTSLIQETEKTENLAKICKVYDAFLAEFPLCYGYWKKYADHEAHLGSADKIVEVYERAVQAVTYSVDIWMHYCTFAMSKFENPEDTRRLFERGLSYVRMDYLSHLLWDKYIEFEYSLQEWSRLAQIYTRILQIPIQQLDRYYNSFKQLTSSRPLSDLLTEDEVSALSALASASSAVAASAPAASSVDAGGEGGEVVPDGEEVPKAEGTGLSEAEELEKYLAVRESMYKKAKEFDAKIRDFEAAIRRPYFHVKPLDDIQLGNWHRYLDFIEKEGDFDLVVKVYERCLIACANYPEYWIRYAQCAETHGNMELASDAVARATHVFVKRQPEVHIFAARFKEQMGDIVGARSTYQILSGELAPGLVEAVIKHANMEKRQGNIEGAMSVYETAIDVEKGKEESRALPLLFIQYSRFLDQVAGNVDKAREVLVQSLKLLPHSKPLLVAVIHFESICSGPKQINFLDSVVEHATASKSDSSQTLTPSDQEEISSIFLEFVDIFGDIHAVKKAEARHKQLFLPRKTSTKSKKRSLADSSASDRAKVAKTDVASATAASPAQSNPAYANGQSQWGVGYGAQGYAQQPQNWQQPPPQQAPQGQPQQWNPGYDQQGGYGAYGSYANYGPQQPPPPQQQQGYGGYNQGYPPQAFPQQNYGQPAPAYTPAQQQPPAQPGYYAGYY